MYVDAAAPQGKPRGDESFSVLFFKKELLWSKIRQPGTCPSVKWSATNRG
jgi:hypothetical protein